MHTAKKILSVLLVCAIFLCSAPLAGFVGIELPEIDFGKIFDVKAGAAEIIDSGSCGENLTYILDSDGILTISGTGNMYDYYSTTAPWCSNCESIKDVVITEGVTSIGDSAFYDCTSLTSVVIPVSIMHIEYDAFYNCTSLNSVFITDLTSWCTIDFKTPESSPLYYAEHLYINNKIATELIIPDSVSSIDNYAFSNSNAFSAVTISATISYIGSIFSSCSSLTEITILNPICGITKIAPQTVIKGYDNSTAQEYANKYDHTFESLGDAPLKTLYSGTLGDNLSWTITNHRELIIGGTGKMIDNIYGEENNPWYPYKSLIKSVIIQHGVENIGDCAFLNLDQITSVVFSDTVKYIGNSAFSGCSNLKTITIPGNVTEIRGLAFSGCTSLTDVILETGVESIQEASFSGCSSLQSIAIPDTVTSIWEAAFDGCESLTAVTIPTGVERIAGYAFRACTSLTSVTIPNSISNIGPDAFYNCSSLTDVYYAGTEEEWDAIEIGNRNEPLLNANIHIYNAIVCPPTCTTQGFTTYICSACDDTYIADFVPALGHNYSSDIIAPSCTEKGYTYYTCTICNHAYMTDEVIANGHDYDIVITEPTCTEQGYTTYTCAVCGYTYVIDEVVANGHSYNAKIIAPTCTEQGYTSYICECGDSYISDYTDATGHNYASEVTTQATHLIDGVKTFTCINCGDTYTEVVDKIGHNYNAIVTAPTCESVGFTTYTCICGDSYVDNEVAVLGHNYVGTITTEPTCTNKGIKTYVCKNDASHTYTESVDETGHDWGKWETVNAATCDVDGCQKRICNNDTSHTEEKVLYAFGHNAGEPVEEDRIEATATVDGSYNMVVYCSTCSKMLNSVKYTISATGYPDGKIILGDIDGDFNVSSADARLALRYAVGLEKFNEAQMKNAEVDNSSGITAADARLILRAAVGLEILHIHEWCEPTCISPKICSICSAVDQNSEPLGHSFVKYICERCGCFDETAPRVIANKEKLILNGDSDTISITLFNCDVVIYEIDNTNIVGCEWGEWIENTISLTFTPNGYGKTTVKVYPKGYEDNCVSIDVLVEKPDSNLTIVGVGEKYSLYSSYAIDADVSFLHSADYEISYYSTGDMLIEVDVIAEMIEDNYSNLNYIGIEYELYDEKDICVKTGNVWIDARYLNQKYSQTISFIVEEGCYTLVFRDMYL